MRRIIRVSIPAALAVSCLLLTVPALLLPRAAQARDEPGNPLEDRFSVELGTFVLNTGTDIRVDGSAGVRGTPFDVERTLGFGDTSRFRLDAYWRFTPRQKIRFMYFQSTRTSSAQLDRTIEFGGTQFPISAELQSQFSVRILELAYEFAFLRGRNYDLAVSVGLHDLKFGLDLAATIRSTTGQPVDLRNGATAEGPLPVVGLRGLVRLSDRVYINAMAQYFQISISPYNGNLQDYRASIVWQAFRHLGFGAGYNAFVTTVNVDATHFTGHLRYRYSGPRIFFRASF